MSNDIKLTFRFGPYGVRRMVASVSGGGLRFEAPWACSCVHCQMAAENTLLRLVVVALLDADVSSSRRLLWSSVTGERHAISLAELSVFVDL